MPAFNVDYVMVGELREEYCLLPSGEAQVRVLGGSAVYSAVGARLWADHIGLVARVGAHYPAEWLNLLLARGFDIQGIKVAPAEAVDTRAFRAYLSWDERILTDPAAHFKRAGLPCPPELADYPAPAKEPELLDRFGPLAVRPTDVPEIFFNAPSFHLAPQAFVAHQTLSVHLRRHGARYITCEPSAQYMLPNQFDNLKMIIHGLEAFLPSETEVRALFREAPDDLWQAAEALGALGAKSVVIKLGARGQYVYDPAAKRRWHVPAYPVKIRNLTGAGDAYCGGFLAGLTQCHEPLEAALRGAVSASFVIEGNQALYALDHMPALAEARLRAVREATRPI